MSCPCVLLTPRFRKSPPRGNATESPTGQVVTFPGRRLRSQQCGVACTPVHTEEPPRGPPGTLASLSRDCPQSPGPAQPEAGSCGAGAFLALRCRLAGLLYCAITESIKHPFETPWTSAGLHRVVGRLFYYFRYCRRQTEREDIKTKALAGDTGGGTRSATWATLCFLWSTSTWWPRPRVAATSPRCHPGTGRRSRRNHGQPAFLLPSAWGGVGGGRKSFF